MPTVHISLPSQIYEELKREAAEFGLQITDIVKMYIRQGVEKRLKQRSKTTLLDERVEILEGELNTLKELIDELFKRLDELEDVIEELKSPVEPELVEPSSSRKGRVG